MKMKPIGILCCYAVEDQVLVENLKKHLSSLQHRDDLAISTTIDIEVGKEREQEIHRSFENAQIILLLVSPDFMASDECYKIQTQQALQRKEQGKAVVIPIILRPVQWKNSPFRDLQVLPTNGIPVTSTKWESERSSIYRHRRRNRACRRSNLVNTAS